MTYHSVRCAAALVLLLSACGEGSSGDGGSGTTDVDATEGDTDDPTEDEDSDDPTDDEDSDDPTEDPTTDDPTDADTGTDEETGDDTDTSGVLEPLLPPVTGTCPTFAEGDLMFNPKGIEPRMVRVWMDEIAYEGGGRLQFYFHGTGGSPMEAEWGYNHWDTNNIDLVTAEGGIVVAPYNDPATGQFPWFLTSGDRDDDLLLMDEVVACAVQELGIDLHKIHSAGFSAGGLHTSKASFLRSVYLASVVIYSGGFPAPGYQPWDTEPENAFAAMVVHGGQTDTYGGTVNFLELSQYYIDELLGTGRFAIECNHEMGHLVGPQQNAVHEFLTDHPWTARPYAAAGLPADFPDYCSIR